MRQLTFAALLLALTGAPALAADHVVEIRKMTFQPATLDVAPGDTVTFVNRDRAPHTATSNDGAFDTGQIANGKAVRITIESGGVFGYHCQIHPMMQGQIQAR